MREIVLRTSGADLVFAVTRVDRSGVEYCLEVRFADDVAVSIPPRPACWLQISDVERLARYVCEHLGPVVSHEILESPEFVTHDLDFRLQALQGERSSGNEGEFELRVLIYCGSPDRTRRWLYAGFESRVSVPDVLQWASDLRALSANAGSSSP